jgi:hypothetical protein
MSASPGLAQATSQIDLPFAAATWWQAGSGIAESRRRQALCRAGS